MKALRRRPKTTATKPAPAAHKAAGCEVCAGLRSIYPQARGRVLCRWCAPEDWGATMRVPAPKVRSGTP